MSRLERVGQLLRQIEHEIQTAFDEHTELLNLNNQLKAENAKLRKLCKRMFKDFVSCDYELRAKAGRTFMAYTRYVLELQELGIEVCK